MRALLTILLSCAALISSAQIPLGEIYSPEDGDDGRLPDNLVFEMTYGMWIGVPDGVEHEYGWPGVNAYWMHDQRFGKSLWSVGIGLGLGSESIHTNARFVSLLDTLSSDGSTFTALVPWHESYEYRKNKMVLNYLDVPVELRFKTRQRFRIMMGFKAGYLLGHHIKRVDEEGKYKNFNTPHVLPYRYGVYGRIGKGKINLNCFMSLTPVFEDGKGEDLQNVSFGLSWFLF